MVIEKFILFVLVTGTVSQNTQWEAWREDPQRNWRKDIPGPNDPVNVTITEVTSGSMRIVWEAPQDESGITSYDIYIQPAPEMGGKDIIYKDKDHRRPYRTDYDYLFEQLRSNTPYRMRVRSIAGSTTSTGVEVSQKTDKALRCYQCTTAIDFASCQDPENDLPFQDSSKLRDCYYKLSKGCTKEKRGWGRDAIVSRGCSYLNTSTCEVRWSRNEWVHYCNCVGDGCNGANHVVESIQVAWVISIVLLKLVM